MSDGGDVGELLHLHSLLLIFHTTCPTYNTPFFLFHIMGNQKAAAKRKPNASCSGTRKSAKENIAPPPSKWPYPKARPAYKVTLAKDSGEEASKGEAEAAAALVYMQHRGQTGQS